MSQLFWEIEHFNPYSPRVHTSKNGMHSNTPPVFVVAHPLGPEKAVQILHRSPSLRNFLRRLSAYLSRKVAFNDPTKEMTSQGWRKKA